jgi:hypothetical protein
VSLLWSFSRPSIGIQIDYLIDTGLMGAPTRFGASVLGSRFHLNKFLYSDSVPEARSPIASPLLLSSRKLTHERIQPAFSSDGRTK